MRADFFAEMSKSETQEAENRLKLVIEHLLKLQCIDGQMKSDNQRGWQKTVDEQRRALRDHIATCPSLKSKVTEAMLDTAYRRAISLLAKDYPKVNFPQTRRLSLVEIMGGDLRSPFKRR